MKQKLAVFPYDSELSCLWKYSDLLQEYEIGCLIVPRGWGLTDQEIPVLPIISSPKSLIFGLFL